MILLNSLGGSRTICGGATFFYQGVEGIVVLGEGQVTDSGGRHRLGLHSTDLVLQSS